MPWIHAGIVAERQQHAANRSDQRGVVAAGQIGAADAAGKERVADEQVEAPFACSRHLEADATGAVARSVVRTRFEVAERNGFAGCIEPVDRWRRRIDLQTEPQALCHGVVVQEKIIPVQVDWNAERTLRRGHARDVVHVRVRQQDVQNPDVLLRHELEQPFDFIAGVDDHAFACPRAGHDEAVLVKRTDRLRLDYDHAVILAILDDLLFTSKIRSTAAPLGVTVTFARSSQAALERMRSEPPSLVILDLNNPRTDPIGTIAAMKADAALASIPTLGYVSHVDTATIDAARTAGIDDVVARSAFATNLREILSARGGQP
jgi:CheY-like chemotaxis protein